MFHPPSSHQTATDIPRFRNRGKDVSRLEAFSDVVFGFALTLVVVSLEVPRTFDDLLVVLLGGGSFLVCFGLLVQIWLRHFHFFRRYGLSDRPTTLLNMILLFVVLFYVYPLKFLFNVFINGLVAQIFQGHVSPAVIARLQPTQDLTSQQVTGLYVIYGIGFATIYILFALLYRHAGRMRTALALNELEIFETQAIFRESLLIAGVGVLSIVVAVLTGDQILPGLAYFGFAAVRFYTESTNGPKRRQVIARMQSAAQPPDSNNI